MAFVSLFLLGLVGLFWPVVALMALALLVRICTVAKRLAAIGEENLELNRQRIAHLEEIASVLVSMKKSAPQSDLPL